MKRAEQIARSRGMIIKKGEKSPIVKGDDQKSKPQIKEKKNRVVIEKDNKKYTKPNIKRVKAHGDKRIFDINEFQNRQVKGLDIS